MTVSYFLFHNLKIVIQIMKKKTIYVSHTKIKGNFIKNMFKRNNFKTLYDRYLKFIQFLNGFPPDIRNFLLKLELL